MIFKDAKGFSLVEMMVVVATISLLAAVGIPQYSKFKRKAHETEAKVSLGAIYVTEKSFHGEYSFYHTSLQAIGFGLEGRHYFNVGFGTTTAVVPAAYGFNAVVDDTIMDIRSLCVGYNGTGSDVSCQLMVDIPDIPTVSTATADDFFAAVVNGFHAMLQQINIAGVPSITHDDDDRFFVDDFLCVFIYKCSEAFANSCTATPTLVLRTQLTHGCMKIFLLQQLCDVL